MAKVWPPRTPTEKTSHDKYDEHEDGICQRKPDHRGDGITAHIHGHDTDTAIVTISRNFCRIIGTVPEKSSPTGLAAMVTA